MRLCFRGWSLLIAFLLEWWAIYSPQQREILKASCPNFLSYKKLKLREKKGPMPSVPNVGLKHRPQASEPLSTTSES